jgi:acetolactate synthase-1/2/3 large subunit
VPDTVSRTELRPPPYTGPGVRYRDAMTVLDHELPRGVDIVVDAGNTGAAAIHYLAPRRDGRFLVALGMGGMGYGFGAGIGTAFARGRRTVVIAGDGAFFMHGMEIHTAVQYRLPVLFVLLNNNAHGMCVTREQLFYHGWHSYNRYTPSHLGAGLASMLPGLPAVDTADAGGFGAALRTALAHDGPSVISVDCAADEIPPFAPFLTAGVSAPTRREDHRYVASSTC